MGVCDFEGGLLIKIDEGENSGGILTNVTDFFFNKSGWDRN